MASLSRLARRRAICTLCTHGASSELSAYKVGLSDPPERLPAITLMSIWFPPEMDTKWTPNQLNQKTGRLSRQFPEVKFSLADHHFRKNYNRKFSGSSITNRGRSAFPKALWQCPDRRWRP